MGWSLVAWIVGGFITIVGGLCFAELGASMPVAGGQTVYLSKAYSPAFGFINGFSCFLLTGSGGVAALAMAAVTAYRTVFEISDIMVKVLAIAIILVLICLLYTSPYFLENQTMAVYLAEPVADLIAVTFTMILFRSQFKKALHSM